jgi:hypothetical protein
MCLCALLRVSIQCIGSMCAQTNELGCVFRFSPDHASEGCLVSEWALTRRLSGVESLHDRSGCFLSESVVNFALTRDEVVAWCHFHIERDETPDPAWSVLIRQNRRTHHLEAEISAHN